MNILQQLRDLGQALIAAVAYDSRQRAIASLSRLQLVKLGVDRRSLAYYAVHGRPPSA
jgi:hypothetical protein